MHGNSNCSEMVTTLLTIVLYSSQLACYLKGRFNGQTVYYEIQVARAKVSYSKF